MGRSWGEGMADGLPSEEDDEALLESPRREEPRGDNREHSDMLIAILAEHHYCTIAAHIRERIFCRDPESAEAITCRATHDPRPADGSERRNVFNPEAILIVDEDAESLRP
jgi:hypothetical protein